MLVVGERRQVTPLSAVANTCRKYFGFPGREVLLNTNSTSVQGTRGLQASKFEHAWIEVVEDFHLRSWRIMENPELLTG